MRSQLKIARALSPRTIGTSGRALLPTSSFDQEWASTKNLTTTFFYSKHPNIWYRETGRHRNFYLSGEGILWLLSLGYRLICGKYHMYVAGTGSPEHIIAFVISKMLKKPILIMESHWWWPETLLARLAWPLAKQIAQHATVLAVAGRRVQAFWRLSGILDEKMRTYHMYYSTFDIRDEHVKQSEQIKRSFGNKKIVLFLGRLVKYKGVDYLIKSFAALSHHHQDAILVIAGDGPERANLERLSMDLGLNNVFFAGSIREDVKIPYFLACDVFLGSNPSIDSPEEWGLVVNEAMSAAKPVIVTESVGCAYDLVSHGTNGYILKDRDVQALSLAIQELLENDALRVNMGQASSRIIGDFTYENAVKSLNECIGFAHSKYFH